MRQNMAAVMTHYLDHLGLEGDVLEIGGFELKHCAIPLFPEPRFRFVSADIQKTDIPHQVEADITDCREQFADNSFDIVVSFDVFEHITKPWLAAPEIARILKPGGIVLTRTLFSWRNHPCPIDYWRYSPDCLDFLFGELGGLESLESGFDLSERRRNMTGFWPDGMDSVPVDAYGGFRENWAVYSVHRKGDGPAVPRFKDSDHPLAHHLRATTQGTVTNPTMLGRPVPPAPHEVLAHFRGVEKKVDSLLRELRRTQRALDERIIGMGQPLSVRAYRKVRRRLRERRAVTSPNART